MVCLPLTSGFANTVQLLVSMKIGRTMVMYDGIFMPNKVFRAIEEYKITGAALVPSMLKVLAEAKKPFQSATFQRFHVGGEKLNLEDFKVVLEKFKGVRVFFGYGMSETSPVIATTNPSDWNRFVGTVGRPLGDFKIRVVDKNNNPLGCNQTGRILVSGTSVMLGYLRMGNGRNKEGWLETGDLGYVNEEGYIYINGREKNVIISCGKNVYIEDVERIIDGCEIVKEERVYSVADEIIGEKIAVDIVVKEDCEKDEERIRNYCKEYLEPYQIPRLIHFVDAIERTSTNKIIRK